MSKNTPDLKEKILIVAERRFRQQGYDQTTFQQIADELGITKGAISYHFKNKYLIGAYFIQEMFDVYRDFIKQYKNEIPNIYCMYCILYIYVYRIVMSNPINQELFYHKDQINNWQTGRVQSIYGIYSEIVTEYKKQVTYEDVMMKVIMDLGARKRMYEEYKTNTFLLNLDKYCYYHVYLIGALSRLEEEEIATSIETAFQFANKNKPPKLRLFV